MSILTNRKNRDSFLDKEHTVRSHNKTLSALGTDISFNKNSPTNMTKKLNKEGYYNEKLSDKNGLHSPNNQIMVTNKGVDYCKTAIKTSLSRVKMITGNHSRCDESPIQFSPNNFESKEISIKHSPDLFDPSKVKSPKSLMSRTNRKFIKSQNTTMNLFAKLDVNSATEALYILYQKYKMKSDGEEDYDDFIGSYIGKNKHEVMMDEVSMTNTSRWINKEPEKPVQDKILTRWERAQLLSKYNKQTFGNLAM